MPDKFIVSKNYNKSRFDKWFKEEIINLPNALIQKLLRKNKIKVNKKKIKTSFRLSEGDEVYVFNLSNYKPTNFKKKIQYLPTPKEKKGLDKIIIHDNTDYIVINKPRGIAVQSGTNNLKNIIDIFKKTKHFNYSKPYIVHRLDKETSGIMIISKNHNSARLLTTLFRLRKIHKTYLAVCHGHISKKKGELKNELITFENNKKKIEKAITYYKVLSETDTTSFLELKPVTGRKHQLRKQLAIIDNPIVGDKKYILSNKKIKSDKDLMLHAYSLKFYINNKKFFYKASPPDTFNKYLNKKKLNILNF